MSEIAVQVSDVHKRFRLYRERNQNLKLAVLRGRISQYDEFWALKGVTFDVKVGETFGLVGDNGSGKSTLLKCLAKILHPNSGKIIAYGKVAALLEVGSGFHPELTGRENIYLNGSILGMSKKEIDSKFESIVEFSGVREFIDQPVKNYSSGMYVRLGFSVAIHVEPDILLVDEVLAVGDESFQQKCFEKFAEFKKSGKTVILVSHALGTMVEMCDRIAWLSHGELLGVGKPAEIIAKYRASSH